MDIAHILKQNFVQEKIHRIFGDDTLELIPRCTEENPAVATSFILKRKDEKGLNLDRVIILPPHGYTANRHDWMNSHAEAHHATIEVLGGVRATKSAFSQLKDCLKFTHAPRMDSSVVLNVPYKETMADGVETTLLSSDMRVKVVKPDGFGFYHNLTNETDDWLMLKLEKHLRPQQAVDSTKFPTPIASLALNYYQAVQHHGDEIFQIEPELVKQIVDSDPHQSIPTLIEMLKIYDAGRHEACTIFATLLPIGKANPDLFHHYATQALDAHFEPAFYLNQLNQKIDPASPTRQDGQLWQKGAPAKGSGFANRLTN